MRSPRTMKTILAASAASLALAAVGCEVDNGVDDPGTDIEQPDDGLDDDTDDLDDDTDDDA
jgi:hypothetical protein